MYSPLQILSKNTKCGCSINLPIRGHCRPTKACAFCCYARTGKTSMPESIRKQAYVSDYLVDGEISRLVGECSKKVHVRLNGTGDFLSEHVGALLNLAGQCLGTQFWGMTRKTEIANALNGKLSNLRMLVTVDATSPRSTWAYKGAMCYGPRRPGDVVPVDKRIKVVFPRHFAGRVVKGVERHVKDCLGVWHDLSGCNDCGRCWSY